MSSAAASPSQPFFASGLLARMWARLWPAVAFYPLAAPAGVIRGIADDIGLPVRRSFTGIEEVLLTAAPTHWLQGSPLDTHAMQLASTTVYITWFLAPITAGIGVLLFRPHDYWRFIAFLLIAYYAVMPFFALYPLEAPWAHDASIRRFVAETFPDAAARDPNPYAAMPSLHVALPAAAALWYGLRSWMGRLVLSYSALIGLVVVYGGDHYLADVLAGYAVAAATFLGARALRLPVFASEPRASDQDVLVPAQGLRRAA
jgi:hypothetical protein